MVLELSLRPDSVTNLESFLATSRYKQLAESTMSFNRRLNEERKMRIPYIDGQTGVAQKHYPDQQRSARERMPGLARGQVYSYPQRLWRKRRYQYLQYFMLPKHLRYEPEPEFNTGVVGVSVELVTGASEDSNGSINNSNEKQWETIYEDDFSAPEPEPEPESDDSDFEFDGVRTKKVSKRKKDKERKEKEKEKEKLAASKPVKEQSARRRTHADSIPDSEKPFACDLCLARYKTRPGLTYHYNHSHKDRDLDGYSLPDPEDGDLRAEHEASGSPSTGSDSQDTAPRGHYSGYPGPVSVSGNLDEDIPRKAVVAGPSLQVKGGYPASRPVYTPLASTHKGSAQKTNVSTPDSAPALPAKPHSSGYCDFCLGDSSYNKKSLQPEELIGCSECGRSGHPSCLQFTTNMKISVRKYPWQCIECKTCSLCGTSENDDQLLFCDDCDRGYHMYCLDPPMKVAPEGSWSCQICVDTFHSSKK